MTNPAWPFPTNWSSGVTERLEWLTVILTSPSGAEQRYAPRIGPRRSFDLPFLVADHERTYLDALLMSNLGKEWYVPIPHEETHLPGQWFAGTTVFPIDTNFREWAVGQIVMIADDPLTWEIRSIIAVTSESVTLDSGITNFYSSGLRIAPCFRGRLTEKITASRPAGKVFTGTARFVSVEAAIWPLAGRTLDTYPFYGLAPTEPSYPLLMQEPNSIDNLDYGYEPMYNVLDNDVGIPQYVDTANRVFTSQVYNWFLVGKQERSDFRDWLYMMHGRRNLAWVPTFNDDLSVDQTFPDPDAKLGDMPGRDIAFAFLRDGRVVSYFTAPETRNDGYPSAPLRNADVRRISYGSLKRLDTDQVEILHNSDVRGVASCSVVMRDAPELRVATAFTPLPYADAVYHQSSGDVAATNPSSPLSSGVTITG